MAQDAVKLTTAQVVRVVILVAIVGPIVGFVLLALGIIVGAGVRLPKAYDSVVFTWWFVFWFAVAGWSAMRARRSTFWALTSAASSVVVILLVSGIGVFYVFDIRMVTKPWDTIALYGFAICAYAMFVAFFLWGALIDGMKRRS
jgi:hypothetical protein